MISGGARLSPFFLSDLQRFYNQPCRDEGDYMIVTEAYSQPMSGFPGRAKNGPDPLAQPPWPGWPDHFGAVVRPDFEVVRTGGRPDLWGGPARLGGWSGPICGAVRPDWGGGPARFGGWSGRVAGGPATHQIGLSPPLTGHRFLHVHVHVHVLHVFGKT